MLVLILCTEGENSEPVFISHLERIILGQVHPNIDIVEVPLGGNHGHTERIFEEADKRIDKLRRDEDSILSLVYGKEDEDLDIERVIICDYDKMWKHNITEEDFRKNAARHGYRVILNKPKFEFFVLAFVTTAEFAATVKPEDYEKEINAAIDRLNKRNQKDKGFTEAMNIPHYSKRKGAADTFFGRLFDNNGLELVETFCKEAVDLEAGCYSQMGEVMREIQEAEAKS